MSVWPSKRTIFEKPVSLSCATNYLWMITPSPWVFKIIFCSLANNSILFFVRKTCWVWPIIMRFTYTIMSILKNYSIVFAMSNESYSMINMLAKFIAIPMGMKWRKGRFATTQTAKILVNSFSALKTRLNAIFNDSYVSLLKKIDL